MEYRKVQRSGDEISVIGLGASVYENCSDSEIENIISRAIDRGVNYFDAAAGARNFFAPFGRAIKGHRDKIYFQLHIGAAYDERGQYERVRGGDAARHMIKELLAEMGTDYIDYCFLHCVDDAEDWDTMRSGGDIALLEELCSAGIARHTGLSSHTPEIASRIIDEVDPDILMFSINPAYDYEHGGDDDDFGRGTSAERSALLSKCQARGIGISVMKPFGGGRLLDASMSPFHTALTTHQLIQYSLDRPGVLTVLPGVKSMGELDAILGYSSASPRDRDYSQISAFTPDELSGTCVYCGHCQPCPAGINIALVNKYYDLARAGDKLAADHYSNLLVKAGACVRCRRCDSHCPFKVGTSDRMREILAFFGE